MMRYAFVDFLQDIMGWLIIGIIIAALIAVFIPDDFFAGRAGNNIIEMLVILVAAIPVYVCATASVPVAAVLMLKGLSPGAALVLLMAGPATNAATITMIGKVMGRKSLISYMATIIAGALLFGFAINTFLPGSWFVLPQHMMSHDHQMLPEWLSIGSAVILALLIINGYYMKFFGNKSNKTVTVPSSARDRVTLEVKGMTCNHCKQNVENAVSSVKGVESAEVDLAKGTVTITGENYDVKDIRSGIEDVGYSCSIPGS